MISNDVIAVEIGIPKKSGLTVKKELASFSVFILYVSFITKLSNLERTGVDRASFIKLDSICAATTSEVVYLIRINIAFYTFLISLVVVK